MEDLSLKWQAPEYHHYERSTDWYWAVGIITVCLIALSFFFGNPLLGVLILLSAIILIYFVFRVPNMIDYEINNRGIIVGKELLPYKTLEAFWIETRAHEPKLILKSKKTLQPLIVIPIHEDSVDDIGSVLNQFVEEKELAEPASHQVMEYLGF